MPPDRNCIIAVSAEAEPVVSVAQAPHLSGNACGTVSPDLEHLPVPRLPIADARLAGEESRLIVDRPER
jgi:hypothetical protein